MSNREQIVEAVLEDLADLCEVKLAILVPGNVPEADQSAQ